MFHAVISAVVLSLGIVLWLEGAQLPPITWVFGLLMVLVTLRSWREYDRTCDP